MTSAEVIETSVNVIINSPSQDYIHPDDHTSLTYNFFKARCFTEITLRLDFVFVFTQTLYFHPICAPANVEGKKAGKGLF